MNAVAAPSLERWTIAALLSLLLAMLPAVGVVALLSMAHLPVAHAPLWAMGLSIALGLLACPRLAKRLPPDWDGAARAHPGLSALWLLLALAAIARTAGVALFMVDAQQAQASAYWFDEFYVRHNCFSGMWKAASLAAQGVPNLYDPEHYTGMEGRFKLDDFLYLPQFLILPRAGLALGGDFLPLRALWFALEGALLAFSVFALARWIGGAAGRRLALLLPVLWLTTPVLLTLQLGNFQIAAIAMSLLAMMLFWRQRPVLGSALLGFAVFKLFPGLLGLYLLAARRWREAAWTIAFAALYSLIALAWLGWAPYQAFFDFQAPRILSNESWAFLWLDGLEPVVAINDSVPGLVLKLDLLGLPGMTPAVEKAVSWVWTLTVFALAILSARRAARMSRLELVGAWLALLALAAYRSPFVPDHNGLFAPIWLWALVAAGARLSPRHLALLALGWLLLTAVLPFGGLPMPELMGRLTLSTLSQFVALGLCLWVLLRQPRGEAPPRPLPASATPTLAMG